MIVKTNALKIGVVHYVNMGFRATENDGKVCYFLKL